ncbi:hypothetical protein L2E82_10450 [Cichorium intybus]|uniref:Uncharacterized protein n=1 Tax=Cichorium intybus TaxID=13427 RepID=A0ACB9GAK3_CICIN|nr:hypothetical protein L2E82_10450 [Cichorium intybus]
MVANYIYALFLQLEGAMKALNFHSLIIFAAFLHVFLIIYGEWRFSYVGATEGIFLVRGTKIYSFPLFKTINIAFD